MALVVDLGYHTFGGASMKTVQYALMILDERAKQITVVGTHREPKTLHNAVRPDFHRLCLSIMRMYPDAASIETVAWKDGMKLDQAPLLLTAKRTDQDGLLAYRFPGDPEEE